MVPCGAECFRKIYAIATMVCRFFWHELMLWPEDMKRCAALLVLSGRDTLVPLRLIQARLTSIMENQNVLLQYLYFRAGGALRA